MLESADHCSSAVKRFYSVGLRSLLVVFLVALLQQASTYERLGWTRAGVPNLGYMYPKVYYPKGYIQG